jgi:hypothetical protein
VVAYTEASLSSSIPNEFQTIQHSNLVDTDLRARDKDQSLSKEAQLFELPGWSQFRTVEVGKPIAQFAANFIG